jgi:hypothetical protein
VFSILAALVFTANAVNAAAIGSTYQNITFAQAWQVPTGITALSGYFVAPGYVTLLELWAPG